MGFSVDTQVTEAFFFFFRSDTVFILVFRSSESGFVIIVSVLSMQHLWRKPSGTLLNCTNIVDISYQGLCASYAVSNANYAHMFYSHVEMLSA